MRGRIFRNWAYATPPVALLILGLYPFVADKIILSLFLSLPIYMLHQFEEHDNNRFSEFLNGMIGEGAKGLSAADIWIINVIFVWFLLLSVFYLATISPGWGVLAGYLLAVNGALHVIWALVFRNYNPGLGTSIFLFFPLAIWIFTDVSASFLIHISSIILVVFLHVVIMVVAQRQT